MSQTGNTTQTYRYSSPNSLHSRHRNDEETLKILNEYRRTRNYTLRDQIVMQYSNLVESVARRYSTPMEPAEDLAQEGYIGLISAIEGYDATKKVKFSTYATHFIIGQIKHYLRDRGKIIKEPAWLQELNQRIVRTTETLTQKLHRAPDNIEIAHALGMTEEAVAEVFMTREVFKIGSIDGSADSEEETPGVVDIERQKAKEVVVSFQLTVEDRIVLRNALRKLKDLEQRVIESFYFEHLSQTEIAHGLGYSCNYVSHLLKTSIRKMKKILINEERRDPEVALHQIRRSYESEMTVPIEALFVDPLTRLYTRAYFEDRLQEELSWASRESGCISVILIRMENFAAYSRAHGTMRVDEAALELVKTVRASTRKSDILTRHSSDLFALILPYTGQTVTIVEHRLSQNLSKWLSERPFVASSSNLGVSMGGAVYPLEAVEFESLIQLALDRMAFVQEEEADEESLPFAA